MTTNSDGDGADTLKNVDPTVRTTAPNALLVRWFGDAVRDRSDLTFVGHSIVMLLLLMPAAIAFYIPGVFSWWMAPIYWAIYMYLLGPFILMLHNTSHRQLFKSQHAWANRIIPWVVGPFFGQSPETYFVHHMGMHHRDGNLPDDLSSTMAYQRDSFVDFLKYWGRFFFFGDFEMVAYLRARKRAKLLKRFLIGELTFLGAIVGLMFVNWQATFVVLVFPTFFTRLMLMMGNFAQHAFVDPEEPDNDWKSVTTFINSPYNKRCFNDGYHLGHHLKASRHWLDMPDDFMSKRERMIAEQSLVFEKIDYFMIFVLLMSKRYKTLARYHVELDPHSERTEADIIALMKRRVQKIDVKAWQAKQEAA